MFVLLRHPHDEDPEATYALDPHVTPKGIRSINENINYLIKEYGIPSVIYCSPLARCRESAKYMQKYIKKEYNKDVKILIDPRISRHFSSKQKSNSDVRQRTLDYKTPIQDNWGQFKDRVRSFLKSHRNEIRDKNVTVWCITHYLVIRQYSKIYGFPIPKNMPFMWHIGLM
jgi:broad specificity phosphatase PhoE